MISGYDQKNIVSPYTHAFPTRRTRKYRGTPSISAENGESERGLLEIVRYQTSRATKPRATQYRTIVPRREPLEPRQGLCPRALEPRDHNTGFTLENKHGL